MGYVESRVRGVWCRSIEDDRPEVLRAWAYLLAEVDGIARYMLPDGSTTVLWRS